MINKILGKLGFHIIRVSKNHYNPGKLYVNDCLNSFSQYNEDILIDSIFNNKRKGFYVDIGANDPDIFNNTKRFYEKGWHGINIEPNPLLYNKLREKRNNDINLNMGIGPQNIELDFYQMSEDTLSSFSKEILRKNQKMFGAKVIDVRKIKVVPLAEIFDKYVKENIIDFISLDVEGLELEVLRSNNWERYKPRLVLVEIFYNKDLIEEYLKSIGYTLIFFNGTNGLFSADDKNANII